MNIVDAGILSVMFLSALMGVLRGFTREVLGLLSWVAAGFLAFFMLPFIKPVLSPSIQNPIIADLVGGLILFIIFLVLFSFISKTFTSLVHQIGLGGVDRSLGFGYGLLRGLILICFVEIFIGAFISRKEYPSLVSESHLSPAIYRGSDHLFAFLPLSIKNLIQHHRKDNNSLVGPETSNNNNASNQAKLSAFALTEIMKSQIQNGGQVIIPPNLSTDSTPLNRDKTASAGKNITEKDNAGKNTNNKTNSNNQDFEELASLKPKAQGVTTNNTTYSKQQQREMDRLLLGQRASTDNDQHVELKGAQPGETQPEEQSAE